VAQYAAEGLEQPERHDDTDPQEEFAAVVVHDTVIYGRSHGGPQERLAHHPADAEEGVEQERGRLLAREPEQVAKCGTLVGRAGVLNGSS